MPALPLDEAGKYVAGAYIVFLALLLIYVAIIGAKLSHIERELGALTELADKGSSGNANRGRSEPNPEGDEGHSSEQEKSETIHL